MRVASLVGLGLIAGAMGAFGVFRLASGNWSGALFAAASAVVACWALARVVADRRATRHSPSQRQKVIQ